MRAKYVAALVAVILVFVFALQANERDEANRLASKYKAKVEVQLLDGTRCDLLSETHAWEVDWATKWAEGVGQTLHYSLKTGKNPGLILLTNDPSKDWRLLIRAAEVCGRHNIDFAVEVTKETE